MRVQPTLPTEHRAIWEPAIKAWILVQDSRGTLTLSLFKSEMILSSHLLARPLAEMYVALALGFGA
jgi:hypothetical protein